MTDIDAAAALGQLRALLAKDAEFPVLTEAARQRTLGAEQVLTTVVEGADWPSWAKPGRAGSGNWERKVAQGTVDTIVRLAREGMSATRVAARLNDNGVSAPAGGRWGSTTIAYILRAERRRTGSDVAEPAPTRH